MAKPLQTPHKILSGLKTHLTSVLSNFRHTSSIDSSAPGTSHMNLDQRRTLPTIFVVALVIGFMLISGYLTVILLSLIAAVLFFPLYQRILQKTGKVNLSASLTFAITLIVIIIPLIITVLITVTEIERMINEMSAMSQTTSLSEIGNQLLDKINSVLKTLTNGAVVITPEKIQELIMSSASSLANFFLDVLTNSFSGIANFITQFILYIFLFTALLTHADTLQHTFRTINPLGDKTSAIYLQRAGEMTKGAVGGQFIIALCQGVAEAGVLYIAGLDYFFFFALILTLLSIIPLGGGVLAIPIGIIMILVGNVWQGLFVLAMHFLVITNIDNILRPRLIPKSVRMNSALMLLSVFGGLKWFGFLGIVIGPVIMILVLTTIQIYLSYLEKNTAN